MVARTGRWWFSMTTEDSQSKKDSAKERSLSIDLDRTDGSKYEYYGRKDVYAADSATEGQEHK